MPAVPKATTTLHKPAGVPLGTLPPEHRYGYLDAKQTGSPWLFDPKRMPKAPEAGHFPAGTRVDAKLAAADLRALGSLLADTYARYPQYGERGVDVAALLERHARRVERMRNPEARKAFLPAIADLRAAVPDNHLIPYVEGGWQHFRADPRLTVQEFRGDAARLDAAAAVKGAFRQTAAALPVADAGSAQARIGSVAVQGADGARQLAKLGYAPVSKLAGDDKLAPVPEDGAYSYREHGDVGIIRLWSFGADGKAARDLQQLVKDAPRHREKSKLIIDMRGNGGGNDGYMVAWIRQMLSPKSELPTPYGDKTGYSSGKQAALSAWNWSVYAQKYMSEDKLQRQMIREGKQAKALWPLSDATRYPPETAGGEQSMTGLAKSDWKGEVAVLVDRRNGSSGESAAMWLRNALGATVVGERTGGYLEGMNVQTYQLPNTGLTLMVPSIRAAWKDPRVMEGAGIPVDVALKDPGAPAEAVAQALFGARAVAPAAAA